MSHAAATIPLPTLPTAFDDSRYETEIQTLLIHATSLEAAGKLMVSTLPQNARDLEPQEVDAIYRLLQVMHAKGQINLPVEKEAVRSAVYIGKTRESRRIGTSFSDEPCLYLVFPHVSRNDEHIVKTLFKHVLGPAFFKTYRDYTVPQVPGGAQRAQPPVFWQKKDHMERSMMHHEVLTHRNEDWSTIDDNLPRNESNAASRQHLHRLSWQHMQQAVIPNNTAHMFRDMILFVVVPRIEHAVGSDDARGVDFKIALREALSFCDNDLNPEFLGEGRVLYSGACHLSPRP
jgi:hypothetical protein